MDHEIVGGSSVGKLTGQIFWNWKYQKDEGIFICFDVIDVRQNWKVICVSANNELVHPILNP